MDSGLSIGTQIQSVSSLSSYLGQNVHTTHICSVQLFSLLVVAEGALVCPPLGHSLKLLVPDHLFHVGGCGLGPAQAAGLLALGHPPPELVVLVQDGGLGGGAQLPELSLGGALS